jgi:hypothetical protein
MGTSNFMNDGSFGKVSIYCLYNLSALLYQVAWVQRQQILSFMPFSQIDNQFLIILLSIH